MKMSVLFEHEKMNLWYIWYFVENKTAIMEHVLKMQ